MGTCCPVTSSAPKFPFGTLVEEHPQMWDWMMNDKLPDKETTERKWVKQIVSNAKEQLKKDQEKIEAEKNKKEKKRKREEVASRELQQSQAADDSAPVVEDGGTEGQEAGGT